MLFLLNLWLVRALELLFDDLQEDVLKVVEIEEGWADMSRFLLRGAGGGVKFPVTERGHQERHLLPAADAVETFFMEREAGGQPAQALLGFAPALDAILAILDFVKQRFDGVGAAKRAAQQFGEFQPVHG